MAPCAVITTTAQVTSKKFWQQLAADMRRIYTAPNADAAWAAFEEFEEKWAKPYPVIATLWRNAWSTFIPFLDYDVEIRRALFSTNAIASQNARYRRAVNAEGRLAGNPPSRFTRTPITTLLNLIGQ